MATAPQTQVSCRLAAVALACLTQAALGSPLAQAQPPSLSCIHTTAVAAYAASVSRSAPALRELPPPAPSAASARRPAPPETAQPAQPRAEEGKGDSVQRDAHTQPEPAPAATPAQTERVQAKSAATPGRASARPLEPKRPPPLPSIFERLGGSHAKRAMQVAQGVPAGRVALRPMFWMTRDQRGGMVALGGRF